MRVTPDKRSAVRGNEVMNTPLFPPSAEPAYRLALRTVERGGCCWVGYPGRQSLRFFALGYFLLAPAGRQMEPPDVG